MTARLSRMILAAGALALGACTSFDAKWNAASKGATRWDGRWSSEKHHAPGGGPAGGRLRCILTEIPGAARERSAAFHANWMLFSSDYAMKLTPVPGSRTDFRGTHELPKMFGGIYRYDARISGSRFTARYDSSYDHGTFALRRVAR
jgi:hypothetical protein